MGGLRTGGGRSCRRGEATDGGELRTEEGQDPDRRAWESEEQPQKKTKPKEAEKAALSVTEGGVQKENADTPTETRQGREGASGPGGTDELSRADSVGTAELGEDWGCTRVDQHSGS